jgi:hypothetical protein
MSTKDRPRLRAGDYLPPLELPAAPIGATFHLVTQGRDATVLLLVPAQLEPWKSYLAALAATAAEIEQWYARILLVLHGDLRLARRLRELASAALTVLVDPQAETHRQSGVDPAHAALLIVDRYGQIYDAVEAARPDDLPSLADIQEWTKFLATQCPECGVIDEPGHGEWALT